jgi:hypothetical protein
MPGGGGVAATAVESSVSGVAPAVAAAGGEQEHGRPGDDDSERGGEGDSDCRACRAVAAIACGDQLACDRECGDPATSGESTSRQASTAVIA